jgi:hypothetical protein
VQAGDPAALLRTFLAHGRLEEAAELALDILDEQKKQVSRRKVHWLAVSVSDIFVHLGDPGCSGFCLRQSRQLCFCGSDSGLSLIPSWDVEQMSR